MILSCLAHFKAPAAAAARAAFLPLLALLPLMAAGEAAGAAELLLRAASPEEKRLPSAGSVWQSFVPGEERAAAEKKLQAPALEKRQKAGKIIPYHQLPAPVRKKAEAVYSVSMAFFFKKEGELWQTRVIATGFLISPGVFVTAAHVVKILDQRLPKAEIKSLRGGHALRALRILNISEKHDLAIVEVEALNQGGRLNPGAAKQLKYLSLRAEDISPGDKIYGLGYPEGAEAAFEAAGALYQDEIIFWFNKEPPFRGMSGAPVLNEAAEAVGIYKSALYTNHWTYIQNEATKAARLKELLEEAAHSPLIPFTETYTNESLPDRPVSSR